MAFPLPIWALGLGRGAGRALAATITLPIWVFAGALIGATLLFALHGHNRFNAGAVRGAERERVAQAKSACLSAIGSTDMARKSSGFSSFIQSVARSCSSASSIFWATVSTCRTSRFCAWKGRIEISSASPRPAGHPLAQRLALDVLGRHEADPALRADLVDRQDLRVVQR